MTDNDHVPAVHPEAPVNATTDDLKRLNGLLVRKLTEKIEDGSATSSDLSTAMHLMKSNHVSALDPRVPDYSGRERVSFSDLDWPVKMGDA